MAYFVRKEDCVGELRIRIKIAEYEFEADGLNDIVRAELASFKRLLPAGIRAILLNQGPEALPIADAGKVLRADGRVVSMKVRDGAVEDVVLALLLGQKQFRNNERVTGAEIMDGLRASGHRINRIDNVVSRHAAGGRITVSGKGRSRRYKLTNPGVEKAHEFVRRVITSVRDNAVS